MKRIIQQRLVTLGFLVLTAIASLLSGCSKPGTETGGPGSSVSVTPSVSPLTLDGFVGGEKLKFLQNEKIQQILAEKYGVTLHSTKAGSLEMVSGTDLTGKDFLWPSNDLAVDLFRRQGGKIRRDQIVFNSPIVIYTGWNIANALSQKGIVEKRPQGYFIVKFREMLGLITEQKSWKDIGLNFSGPFLVRCTDPTKSNSGNMFAGLVANTLNDGTVVDEQSVEKVLPDVKKFFSRLGMMERSSDDIFRKFIAVGTTNSMVVGYESQIVEFIVSNPKSRELIQNSVCVLYPEPTIWSSHPVISLNERGDRLIEAMLDEQIQKLAWSEHGFRSGLVGVTIDPSAVNLPFMPETIDNVIGLPSSKTFQRILEALQSL